MGLQDVRVGDEVTIFESEFRRHKIVRIAVVVRVTPTQLILSNGDRWRKQDGAPTPKPPSYRYRRQYVRVTIDAHRYAEEHQALVTSIHSLNRDLFLYTKAAKIEDLRELEVLLKRIVGKE